MASFNRTNCFVAARPTKPLHAIATRNPGAVGCRQTGDARHFDASLTTELPATGP
jgi:hypothetical protein